MSELTDKLRGDNGVDYIDAAADKIERLTSEIERISDMLAGNRLYDRHSAVEDLRALIDE